MSPLNRSDRYARLEDTFIERARVASAVALIGGAGALGNEVAKNLAMLGLGRILLVDFDIVEHHNATRSVLLCLGDLERAVQEHRPKASYVAESVERINPDVSCHPWVGDIERMGPGVFRRVDLVFSTFDNLRARFITAERCARVGRPMFDGGLGSHPNDIASGAVTAYDSRTGPCFACQLTRHTRTALSHDLAGSTSPLGCSHRAPVLAEKGGLPSTPMMASVVGGAQALLGIKALMGHPRFPVAFGETTRWHLSRALRMESLRLKRNPSCSFHEPVRAPDLVLEATSDELHLSDLVAVGEAALERPCAVALPAAAWSRLRCRACEATLDRWATARRARDLACPLCGAPGLTPLGDERVAFSPAAEAAVPVSLRDLGFAWGEWYEVYALDGSRSLLVEVGGDLDALLASHPAMPSGLES